jgi:iron complex transport system substrate-binding protein
MRIVSLCPSNTELLVALGLWDDVVGVDDDSDWPPAVNTKPRVGRDLNIDAEKVAALQPDLVVASLSVPGMERNIEELERLGLPYIVLNPQHIDEIADNFRLLGSACGVPARGQEEADKFLRKLETIASRTTHVTYRPTLYWEWWPNPVYTPGRDNWLTDISRLAGGENLFAEVPTDNVKTDHASVAAKDPDFVLIVWCGVPVEKIKKEKITGRPEWDQMSAVRNNRVHILQEGYYCRPSQRLLTGLEALVNLIHPEL